jgi:hypothetical protein
MLARRMPGQVSLWRSVSAGMVSRLPVALETMPPQVEQRLELFSAMTGTLEDG